VVEMGGVETWPKTYLYWTFVIFIVNRVPTRVP